MRFAPDAMMPLLTRLGNERFLGPDKSLTVLCGSRASGTL
jgi:hypothetical protein